MAALTVGIDIAKASFAAALWLDGTGQPLGTFPNTATGLAALADAVLPVQRRRGARLVQLVVEPTGGYELALATFALQQGWRVAMPNPKQVREWARGLGRRAKTDAQDALLLARFGADRPLPAWAPLSVAVGELESLLHRKDDLEKLLRQERNRAGALAARPTVADVVAASVAQVIASLEQALATIDAAIHAHLAEQPALRREAQLLQSVPGIGPTNAPWLLVLLHRWSVRTAGRGRAKGLVASVGLDPRPFESGSSVRRRATISRMGATQLRRRLFMSALGGTRGKNPLRQFYLRLIGRGKAKMLALVAAARKVLVWAWAVFRTGTAFDPQKVRAAVVTP
jgi:transposase